MITLGINAANGKMGATVLRLALESKDVSVSSCYDYKSRPVGVEGIPVYSTPNEDKDLPGVIVDFSVPESTSALLKIESGRRVPLVIATSGLDAEIMRLIEEYSQEAPVFQAANMSVGIHLLKNAVQQIASFYGDAIDIEIVEKYHRMKKDSPSGTALFLADAIQEKLPSSHELIFGRHGKESRRKDNEIAIHSFRGGTITGEYDIIFAGRDELLQFSHKAYSRTLFAAGALKAALFTAGKKPGIYHMDDLLKE